jgi:hypothetical protein
MWALTLSVAALVLTLLNTTLRPPCHLKPLDGTPEGLLPVGVIERDGTAAPAGGGDSGARHLWGAREPPPAARPRTLAFQVCNGFANQRLALLYGLIIAKQLGRAVVLPTLITDGTQFTAADRLASDAGAATAPFETFYDIKALRTALAPYGVAVVTQQELEAASTSGKRSSGDSTAAAAAPLGAASVSLAASKPISDVPWRFSAHRGANHLSLDCPLFKLAPNVVVGEQKFVWSVLGALRPSAAVEVHVRQAMAPLEGRPFNFLHIRLERDWQAHCARWVQHGAGWGLCADRRVAQASAVHEGRHQWQMEHYRSKHANVVHAWHACKH